MTTPADDTADLGPHLSAPIIFLQVAAVTIPPDRQRKAAAPDEALLASISARGVLNPIIVRDGNVLVAGERRLEACRQLNLSLVPARNFEALEPLEAFMIELQENLARKQLAWQEEVAAISSYHSMKLALYPEWTQLGTANDLGVSPASISLALAVAAELGDPAVSGCQTRQAALNFIQARNSRTIAAAKAKGFQFADTISELLINRKPATKEEATAALLDIADGKKTLPPIESAATSLAEIAKQASAFIRQKRAEEPAENQPASQIIQASFPEWAATYSGIPFDVIHCDFPYGKNYKGSGTSRQAEFEHPVYDDSEEALSLLMSAFFAHQERLCAPQAHCIFWMAMEHYTRIIADFEAAGWRLSSPYPLVWTKGNTGAPGDPNRRFRHCYETALLFSRGDRKIVKMVQDHFAAPLDDEKLHLSQKPIPMLKHFLSGVCDENTRMLDPTCGSGSAVAAANQLQLDYAVGIEIDPDNVDIARLLVDRKASEGEG